jgi:hypothetical protein
MCRWLALPLKATGREPASRRRGGSHRYRLASEPMRHAGFRIGAEFRCAGRLWRCTDIGTRTIVAIRVDRVEVGGSPPLRRTRSGAETEAEGWFRGPPYAVLKSVFDENDLEACAPGPEQEDA